jgi:hypothetical protein
MNLELPRPVAAYLAADNADDPELLDECFAVDARVYDEEHDYRGLEAIKAWKRDAKKKYRYVMEPIDATVNDGTVELRAKVSGDFPGSPVEIDYTFTLAGDRITSLEIH